MNAVPNIEVAHKHLHAQFREAFGGNLDRPIRLAVLTRVTGHPISTTSGWTEEQYRWTAKRLRQLAECPDSAAELLRDAVAEVAPSISADDLAEACRQDLSPAESVDQTLALLDRCSEIGHELFYALGDAALVLLAAAPGARKKDVLAEHLREKEALKPLLCPDGEGDPVTQWLMLERTAARIPVETRLEFENVPFGYHKAAALTLMDRDGMRVPPDLAAIEARLSAVSDAEYVFRKPADLKEWITAGCRTAANGTPERPDHEREFRDFCAWLKLDAPIADALLGSFFVRKRGKP